MRSQRFHTEDLRGVMSTEQKVHTELFSGNNGPVRSFASDKGVDAILRDPVDLRACATCHNADGTRLLRAEIEDLYRAIQCSSQFTNEFATRHRRAHFQAGRLAFFLQKWLRRPEFKCGDELCVVANFWMDIQRKVRTVEGDIIFKSKLQLSAERASHWLQARPEQTVVDDQKIDFFLCGLGQNAR